MQQCDKLFNKPLLSFLEKKNHNSLFCWKYDDIKTVPVKFLKKKKLKKIFFSVALVHFLDHNCISQYLCECVCLYIVLSFFITTMGFYCNLSTEQQ